MAKVLFDLVFLFVFQKEKTLMDALEAVYKKGFVTVRSFEGFTLALQTTLLQDEVVDDTRFDNMMDLTNSLHFAGHSINIGLILECKKASHLISKWKDMPVPFTNFVRWFKTGGGIVFLQKDIRMFGVKELEVTGKLASIYLERYPIEKKRLCIRV
jgi:hypothetical protein